MPIGVLRMLQHSTPWNLILNLLYLPLTPSLHVNHILEVPDLKFSHMPGTIPVLNDNCACVNWSSNLSTKGLCCIQDCVSSHCLCLHDTLISLPPGHVSSPLINPVKCQSVPVSISTFIYAHSVTAHSSLMVPFHLGLRGVWSFT
eukprot:5198208-Ditylum_brightwellii.AAC.1